MLGDAANSYNPIIQAMIATANLKQRAQGQEAEKEQHKAENEARKQQLKQEEERIKNEHEHQLAQIELQGRQHQLAAEAAQLQRVAMMRDLAVKNVDVSQLGISGLHTPGQIVGAKPEDQLNTPPHVLPTGAASLTGNTASAPPQQFDWKSILPNAAQEAERVRGLAAATAGGTAEGQAPFEQKKMETQFGFQKQLQDAAHESALKIAELGRATQYDIAKLSRSTQMAIANMTNRTHLQIAGMGGDEQSQQVMRSLMLGMATGEIKPSGTNPLERIAYSNLESQGFRPVDAKEIQALRDSQQLLPLFDKLETFAKSLPKTRVGAATQGALLGAQRAIGYTSKQQNDLNIINSQAMNVGKAVEGIGGRPLATQMKLDLDALASGSISQEDAVSRINNLRELYVNKQENGIFSGMPAAQKELIKAKFGVQPIAKQSPQSQPDWLKMAPKTNKKGHKLDDAESVKAGHPVYGEQ